MTVQAQWKSMMQTGYEIENNKNYIFDYNNNNCSQLLQTGQAPEINQIAAPAKGRRIMRESEREKAQMRANEGKEREKESATALERIEKLNLTKNQQ